MKEPSKPNERPAEKRSTGARHSSNIVFNLVALALLLAVIVFLHQMLRKPKTGEAVKQEVNAAAALPAQPAEKEATAQAQPAPEPVQVMLPPQTAAPAPAAVETEAKPEPVAETEKTAPQEEKKQAEARPVVQKPVKKRAETKRIVASQEVSPVELDSEDARQKYLEEDRRLSSGKAKIKKSSTPAAGKQAEPAKSDLDREAAKRFEPRAAYDLDDESARQKYVEENKRLSRVVNTGGRSSSPEPAKRAPSGNDEYIPFENK